MTGNDRARDARRRTADASVSAGLARETRAARLRRWLRPGMGLKRWLLVVFLGQLLLALGGALLLRQVYREVGSGGPTEPLFDLLTMQFLPLAVRIALLLAVGLGLFFFGFWRLVNVLL